MTKYVRMLNKGYDISHKIVEDGNESYVKIDVEFLKEIQAEEKKLRNCAAIGVEYSRMNK